VATADIKTLNETLLRISGELLLTWLPNGRISGKEFECGKLQGPAFAFATQLSPADSPETWARAHFIAAIDAAGDTLIPLSVADMLLVLSDRQQRQGVDSAPATSGSDDVK
jgi:hypothetical protein